MKINGEYPKFYMRVEGRRYAALPARRSMCYINFIDGFIECSFLWRAVGDCESNFLCTKNKIIYIEVQEKSTDD